MAGLGRGFARAQRVVYLRGLEYDGGLELMKLYVKACWTGDADDSNGSSAGSGGEGVDGGLVAGSCCSAM